MHPRRIIIHLLGNFTITTEEGIVRQEELGKDGVDLQILAFLAYKRRASRSEIASAIWDDEPWSNVIGARLRTHLTGLRNLINKFGVPADDVLLGENTNLVLSYLVETDVQAFHEKMNDALGASTRKERHSLLLEALSAYSGELLPTLRTPLKWVLDERLTLVKEWHKALVEIFDGIEKGEEDGARSAAKELLAVVSPRVVAGIRETLLAKGQGSMAIQNIYAELEMILMQAEFLSGNMVRIPFRFLQLQSNFRTEFNREPPAKAVHLAQRARDAIASAPVSPLQRAALPLLGRETVFEEVLQLIETPGLVTLYGPPGVGKTRLATEVANKAADKYGQAVFRIDLYDEGDPDHALASILRSTAPIATVTSDENMPAESDRIADMWLRLEERLRGLPSLLILDDIDVMQAGTPELVLITSLLARIPTLCVLVTSRQLLRVLSELPIRLLPLTPPTIGEPLSKSSNNPSVQLFCLRAQQVKPKFELTSKNLLDVQQLCVKLDGLPLGLMIVASRIGQMSLGRMVKDLSALPDKPSSSVTMDPNDAYDTLESAIGLSVKHLTPQLKWLFTQLSVFVNGGEITAAEAVCSIETAPTWDIADPIQELSDRSLIELEQNGTTPRFRMLKPIREYAYRSLSLPERDDLSQTHATYFFQFALAVKPLLTGRNQTELIKRLDLDYDNLKLAIQWHLQAGGNWVEAGMRLCTALWRFWEIRGYYREASEFYDKYLSHPATKSPSLYRIDALVAAGAIEWRLRHFDLAESRWTEGLSLSFMLGDLQSAAKCKDSLADVAEARGEGMLADTLRAESLEVLKQCGTAPGAMADEKRSVGVALLSAGNARYRRAEYEAALGLWKEAQEWFHAASDQRAVAQVVGNMGTAKKDQYEKEGSGHETATAFQWESLLIRREQNDAIGIAIALEEFGDLAALLAREDSAQADRAAFLYGAVERLRGPDLLDSPSPPDEKYISLLRNAVGDNRLREVWERGKQCTQEQAIAYALDETQQDK